MTKKKDNICPVTNALTILGGKWKINIIYQLSQKTIRFGELRRSLGSVTQQMLSKQLKEMEKDKLINRKVHDVIPPKVEYSLTDLGRSSIPILNSLHHWGNTKKKTINKVIEENYSNVVSL
jgi:DNA-binding HxlR family transcriptional regulator